MYFRCLLYVAAASFTAIIPAFAQPAGIDLTAIDRAASPCQDFYQYACGVWMKNNPIPSDQSRWGRFDELAERNRQTLRAILEQVSPDKPTRSPVQKLVGDAYVACMDEKSIEAKGPAPIQPELETIAKASGRTWLADEVARLHASGVVAFFRFGPLQDSQDSGRTMGSISQSGLSLPDRDYYFKTDPKSVEIRTKFGAHVRHMFEL